MLQIVRAMEEHRSTYLSDPEWIDLPWKDIPKTPFDQLLDLMAIGTNIKRWIYEMEGLESNRRLLEALRIINVCWKLDAELALFFDDLKSRTPGPPYWPTLSTTDNPTDDPNLGKLFPVSFHFINLRVAMTYMTYWSASAALWFVLTYLYQLIPTIRLDNRTRRPAHGDLDAFVKNRVSDHSRGCCDDGQNPQLNRFDMSQLPTLEHRLDFVSMVQNICQSVEYCMLDEHLGQGPATAAMPLALIIDIMSHHPIYNRELLWVRAALENISQTGLRIFEHLPALSDSSSMPTTCVQILTACIGY